MRARPEFRNAVAGQVQAMILWFPDPPVASARAEAFHFRPHPRRFTVLESLGREGV